MVHGALGLNLGCTHSVGGLHKLIWLFGSENQSDEAADYVVVQDK